MMNILLNNQKTAIFLVLCREKPLSGSLKDTQAVQSQTESVGDKYPKFDKLLGLHEGGYDDFNTPKGSKYAAHRGEEIADGKKLSDFTVGEIMQMQKNGELHAVGHYQITKDAMTDAVRLSGVSPDEKFTPEIQDKLFEDGLLKKAGAGKLYDYITGKSDDIDKAMLATAQEWAAFPVPHDMHITDEKFGDRDLKAGDSYYEGVKGNHSHMSLEDAKAAIEEMRANYIAAHSENNQTESTAKSAENLTVESVNQSDNQVSVKAESAETAQVFEVPQYLRKAENHQENQTNAAENAAEQRQVEKTEQADKSQEKQAQQAKTDEQADKERLIEQARAEEDERQRQADEQERRLAQQKAEEQKAAQDEQRKTEELKKEQAEKARLEQQENGQAENTNTATTAQSSDNLQEFEDLRSKAIKDTFNQVQQRFSEIEAKYADKFEKWHKKHPNKSAMGESFYWDYIHEKRVAFGEFHQELHGLNIKPTDLPQEIQDWEHKTHFNLNVINEEPLGNVYPELALIGGGVKWAAKGLWNGGKALLGSKAVKQAANSVKNGVVGAGSLLTGMGAGGRIASGESYYYSDVYDENMCNALYKIAEYPNHRWVNGSKPLWTSDITKEKKFLEHIGVPYEVNGVDMAYFLMANSYARSAGKTGLSLGKFTQTTVGFMGMLGLDTYSAAGTIGNEKGRRISELRTDHKGTAMGYEASFYKDVKSFADAKCKAPKKKDKK